MKAGGSARLAQSLLLVVARFVWTNSAPAQPAYPTRQIQLVVTVPPGGAADFVARMVGAKLADALGQPVIIANRAGAAGTTAAASVAKSDPDGYTLLLNTIATHGIGPHLYANLPYDPAKDFAPVILLARFPLIMTVTASLPARSVADVIALAKGAPWRTRFRISRHRRRPASCRRAVQASGRCRSSAYSLSRQRPCGSRSHRGARRHHVRCGTFAAPLHQVGPASSVGGGEP
jgi:hypothetical protein